MCVCLVDNAEQKRQNCYTSLNFLDTDAAVASFVCVCVCVCVCVLKYT